MERRQLEFLVVALLLLSLVTADTALPPDLVPRLSGVDRPPMGWNSWNTFGCAIDETKIFAAAAALVSSGRRDAGYRYVVVDDCWQAPARAANGSLVTDPVRFPHGMAALGARLHALGLRFASTSRRVSRPAPSTAEPCPVQRGLAATRSRTRARSRRGAWTT
jgi:alpha-galactosidase